MHSMEYLLDWIRRENENTFVRIRKIDFSECAGWVFDENIHRPDNAFFSIRGIRGGGTEQPILIQDEIGFLGIIAREIEGELFFLMQAKIEPGNVNCVQISPTIQATKSNFTRKHGGREPAFLREFTEPKRILVDQLQSEQSSRFLKKRNRNMIVLTDRDVEETDKFKWISLSQLKELMRYDNLVNMDTRTVISCLPLRFMDRHFSDPAFEASVRYPDVMGEITTLYHAINDFKMFDESSCAVCDLKDLTEWEFRKDEIVARYDAPFKVCFCDITIEGREVKHWCQPLFEATSVATFGLICCKDRGVYKFLVRGKSEIGCFDKMELGPTVQIDSKNHVSNAVEETFFRLYREKERVMNDVMLSEEGGRFYHEQNQNIILKVEEPFPVPDGYFWVTFGTLNLLTQVNNCPNIQLRNLLSLLRFDDE